MTGEKWDHFLDVDKSNNNKYTNDNGILRVNAPNCDNNWLCFIYRNACLTDFEYSFDIVLFTEFKEVQVSFLCANLGERYRFMIQDNKEALFELVKKGEFYRNIRKKPYSLSLNEKHNIKVIVNGNIFIFKIDDEIIFNINEKKRMIKGNDLSLILWNKYSVGNINCEISNIKLNSIELISC